MHLEDSITLSCWLKILHLTLILDGVTKKSIIIIYTSFEVYIQKEVLKGDNREDELSHCVLS